MGEGSLGACWDICPCPVSHDSPSCRPLSRYTGKPAKGQGQKDALYRGGCHPGSGSAATAASTLTLPTER